VPTDGPVGGPLTALGRHPMRPAHFHFRVEAPDHRPITTHVFVAGDEYLDSDAAFAVKDALVVTPVPSEGFLDFEFDIRLVGAEVAR
jgi:hydroxyquinol 1,2-dioxygenase